MVSVNWFSRQRSRRTVTEPLQLTKILYCNFLVFSLTLLGSNNVAIRLKTSIKEWIVITKRCKQNVPDWFRTKGSLTRNWAARASIASLHETASNFNIKALLLPLKFHVITNNYNYKTLLFALSFSWKGSFFFIQGTDESQSHTDVKWSLLKEAVTYSL